MKIRSTVGAAMVAAAFSLAGPTLASAASLTTDAFLTNANQDIDFLDRASRLALANSHAAKIKAFAHDQARDQTLAANAIGDWIKADLGPQTAQADDRVATGRSVAIGADASPVTRKLAEMSPPTGQEDLDNLEGLTGKDFDDIYKDREAVTLDQLKDLYDAYATNGDDPALVAIAKGELPKIKRQIMELHRI